MSKETASKYAHLIGKKVTYAFPNFPQVPGTVARATDASIFVTFQHPNGNEVTSRFIPRLNSAAPNAWGKYGTGPLAPKLKFL